MTHIAVMGGGAFGVAMAHRLASRGLNTSLWVRNASVAQILQSERTHPSRLAGLVVHPAVQVSTSMADVLRNAHWVVSALPMNAVREVWQAARASMPRDAKMLSLTKGIEADSWALPHRIFTEVFGVEAHARYAVLSGPSFAHEVAFGRPIHVAMAAHSDACGRLAAELMADSQMRVALSDDVAGVEACGAFKNVLAIAAGMMDAQSHGQSALANLLVEGVHELAVLSMHFGGKAETAQGLAGLGDLALTATGDQSRNRRFGELLAKGVPAGEALCALGERVEGFHTAQFFGARDVRDLAQELSNCFAVYARLTR